LNTTVVFTGLNVVDDDVSNKVRGAFSAHEGMIIDKGVSDKKH
jgi:hypothetical protein